MKKGILCSFGVLFVVSILISGCSKPEEKKAEAPSETKQTMEQPAPAVQEPAPEMKGEATEKTEPTGEVAEEKAPAVPDQAMGKAEEINTGVDVTLEQFKKDIKGGEEFLKSAKGVLFAGAVGQGQRRVAIWSHDLVVKRVQGAFPELGPVEFAA